MKFATVFLDSDQNPVKSPKGSAGHITVAADLQDSRPGLFPLYNPEIHGETLFCGDLHCAVGHETRVHIRRPRTPTGLGGSVVKKAHFATYPNQNHLEHCQHIRDYPEFNGKVSISKDKAISEGKPVLIRINMDLGHPNFGAYKSIWEHMNSKGPMQNWERAVAHASVSVSSAQELWNELHKLRLVGDQDKTLFNAQIGHVDDTGGFSDFNIRDLRKTMIGLFNTLKDEALNEKRITRLPRYVKIIPNAEELKSPNANKHTVKAQSYLVGQNGRTLMHIFNEVEFRNSILRSIFLKHAEQNLLAIPEVSAAQIKTADASFDKGYSSGYRLTWKVISEDQFTPSANAVRIKNHRERNANVQLNLYSDTDPDPQPDIAS